MKEQVRKPDMGTLLTLLLFGVFAVCILMVLLTGADAYRRLTERDQASYDRRTAAQYIATRVRQADRAGGVEVRPFGDSDALVLSEEIDGWLYETRIYYHDGYIRELFTDASVELAPEDGEKVLEAGGLVVSMDDCLRVSLETVDGQQEDVVLYLRSGEGAVS